MERLTDECWGNFDPWECCGQDKYCQRGCHDEGGCTNGCIVPRLYARLGYYEDTGLTPDEIKALIPTPNDPLTLEELREMDGEPIYITGMGWRICNGIDDSTVIPAIMNGLTTRIYLKGYGKNWFAYRRKPEEGKADGS